MHQAFVMLTPWQLNNQSKNGYCNKTYSIFQFLFVIVLDVEQRSSEELMNYFERVKQPDFPITHRACESHKR